MTYIRRWAESEFQMAERIFKAVIFSGVRQCGKTTLMRELLTKDAAYVSLDREIFRQAAADAPGGFLQQYRNRSCLAIDEVQKVPALFHEIKAFVDESRELRQYLLSGSSNYKTMPSIHESMAGRLGEVRLRPMTEGEIQEQPPRFIDRLFNEEFDDKLTAEDCSKRVIIEKALRGGFPDVLRMEGGERDYWFEAYVSSLVIRDLLELGDFRKPHYMQMLLQQCAGSSSRMVNVSSLSAAMEVNRPTVMQYLTAMQTMFLVELLPAWQNKIIKRASSTPKLMLCDSGLMAYLADLGDVDLALNVEDKATTDLVGNLLETWVYQQLVPITDIGRKWKLYHFRNTTGKEIDFILENRNGELICLEVKASEGVKAEHFKNLRWFKEQFGKNRRIWSVVLYTGHDVVRYGEREFALPMAYLWL